MGRKSRAKPIVYSSAGDCGRLCYSLTKRQVKANLLKANVNFDQSLPRENPRKYHLEDDRYTYWIEIEKKLIRVRSLSPAREKPECECNL